MALKYNKNNNNNKNSNSVAAREVKDWGGFSEKVDP